MNFGNPSEEEIFEAARQLPLEQRDAYLKGACGGDDELYRRLSDLLKSHEQGGTFLENPPEALSAKTFAVSTGLAVVAENAGGRIGRYKLLEQIGEGGCGVVYVAEQEQPVRRRVALKVIKLGMDTRQVIARFEAERQALALMDHPNIAKVLDAGATDKGRPFFAMELVKGIPITRYCDENKLNTQQRLNLFIQVCQAVQHAHQKGIIHRDIKPSNILVADHDGVGVPKIIDFGIAKATTDQRLTDKTLYTAIEQFIGTPAYMSPEQAKLSGLDIDTRSDIYSLGVLLYELLTGTTPFDSKRLLDAGLDEIRRIIKEEDPPRPSTRLSTLEAAEQTVVAKHRQSEPPKLLGIIRGDLDWIVMKTLEKDRNRRYESASSLAMDIQHYVNNEPVVAGPPSRVYRFRKLVRRNKFTFAATGVVGFSLVAALWFSTWRFVKERAAHKEADVAKKSEERQRLAAQSAERTAQAQAKRAEAAMAEAKTSLANSEFLRAVRLIEEDKDRAALAYLVASLTANPTNQAAVTRLVTLLTCRSWITPTLTLQHTNGITYAEFSPDGMYIATACDGARVWDARTGKLVTEMQHPGESVSTLSFSPDGKRIATGSFEGVVRVWDARDGQLVAGPMKHRNVIDSVQFSSDGKLVAAAPRFGGARFWHAQSGQPVTEPFDRAAIAVFSPDATRVLTASSDGSACVFDAQTGKLVIRPIRHESEVTWAEFSSDGTQIVTATYDGTVRVWDAKTGHSAGEAIKEVGGFRSARFSPDGKRILTTEGKPWVVMTDPASRNTGRAARVWDAQSGQPLTAPMNHDEGIQSAEFSPDGERIVTASHDGTARVWDARTGQPLTEPLRHRGLIWSAKFSPDGTRVLTASYDKTACVWQVRNHSPLTQPLMRADRFHSASFAPDGVRVLTIGEDSTAAVWSAETGQSLLRIRNDSPVHSAQFSPDGLRIVTASTNAVRVWDGRTGQRLTELVNLNMPVSFVRFSPDGRRVLTRGQDGTARLWDSQTGLPLLSPLRDENEISSATFSPDSSKILTVSNDRLRTTGSARVWDNQTGLPLTQPLSNTDRGFQTELHSAQFSPDGSRVVTACSDGTARIWDAKTGRPLGKPMHHGSFVYYAEFAPDGGRIVTASADKTARVWDAETCQALTWSLRHDEQVHSAHFSPDGQRIVTASSDGTARVWDAETGQALAEPMKHGAMVYSAEFDLDSKLVLTVTGDGTVTVWDVAPSAATYPQWLVSLAQALSGWRLSAKGVLERTNCSEVPDQIRENLGNRQEDKAWLTWGQWFFGNPSGRSISPFSKIRVSEYVENRIKEGKPVSLKEAEMLAAEDADTFRRIREARIKAEAKERMLKLHEQGLALSDKAKLADSEKLCRELLNSSRTRVPVDERELADLLGQLTATLLAEEKFAEGEQSARECMAIREKRTPDDWVTFDIRSLLGGCLVGQKQYAEAEPLLVSGYEGIKQREGKIPASGWNRRKDAFDRLAGFYAATGRSKDAARLRYRVVEERLRREADYGDADALNALAWFLATCPDSDLRDGADAVALAEKAVAATERRNPLILDTLAATYAEVGKFARAISTQKEALELLQNEDEKKDYAARLKLYESNTPFRDPGGAGSGIQ